MIKVYCYGIFADTMTDEEFYEVEKNQRECHAAWAENFSAVSELLEMNHIIDNLTMDNKTDEYIVWLAEMMDDSNILFTTGPEATFKEVCALLKNVHSAHEVEELSTVCKDEVKKLNRRINLNL